MHSVYHCKTEKGETKLTPSSPENLWLYRARVERIVDADTIIVLAELLDNQHKRIRVRLAGVEIPERGTEEEQRAREYLTERLKEAKGLLIKTQGADRYGRYVADILYSRINANSDHILEAGKHLNAELIQMTRSKASE